MSTARTYLAFAAVLERYAGVYSKFSLYEMTRTCRVPHRKMPGTRSLLFLESDLEQWEDGAELETIQLPGGGRICKPVRGGR